MSSLKRSSLYQAGGNNQGLPQGPSAAPRPGFGIKRKRVAERLSACPFEERPRDREIARRVTDAKLSEVDDRTEAARLDQEVAGG